MDMQKGMPRKAGFNNLKFKGKVGADNNKKLV
jgi:hypothetical protein